MKTGQSCFKSCSKCNILKSIEDFNIDRQRKDGRQRYCRECRNKSKREFDAKKKAETGWIVYILPEENYAGLSNNIYKLTGEAVSSEGSLGDHAREGKHGETAVLDFFCFKCGGLLGVLGKT